jgi:hypothetical protein
MRWQMDGIKAPQGEIVCELSERLRQFLQFRPRCQIVASVVVIQEFAQ